MSRRVTVPEDHILLVLPCNLASGLQALLNGVRRESMKINARSRAKTGNIADIDYRAYTASQCLLLLIDAREV